MNDGSKNLRNPLICVISDSENNHWVEQSFYPANPKILRILIQTIYFTQSRRGENAKAAKEFCQSQPFTTGATKIFHKEDKESHGI